MHDHASNDLLQAASGETGPDLPEIWLEPHSGQICDAPDTGSLWQFQQLSDYGIERQR